MTPEALTALTAQIGDAQGKLRAVHLKYHLGTADLLTADPEASATPSCAATADRANGIGRCRPRSREASVQRVLVLGGYGAFGGRVAERLARVPRHRADDCRALAGQGGSVRGAPCGAKSGAGYPRGSGRCQDRRR